MSPILQARKLTKYPSLKLTELLRVEYFVRKKRPGKIDCLLKWHLFSGLCLFFGSVILREDEYCSFCAEASGVPQSRIHRIKTKSIIIMIIIIIIIIIISISISMIWPMMLVMVVVLMTPTANPNRFEFKSYNFDLFYVYIFYVICFSYLAKQAKL